MFYIGLYRENIKNLLVWNHKALWRDIWYVASTSVPLPCLFKWYPWGQKWPCSGGQMFYIDLLRENMKNLGAQWLSGRVLDSRPKGRGFEPHRRHCVVSLSKNINPSLVLVQPRKTRPFITERLLMGRKELNQTNMKNLLVWNHRA